MPFGHVFSVTVENAVDGLFLRCDGELDIATRRIFDDAVAKALGTRPVPRGLTIDLRDLRFLDSEGVRALISAARTCGELGVPYRAFASEQTRRVLAALDLERELLSSPTEPLLDPEAGPAVTPEPHPDGNRPGASS